MVAITQVAMANSPPRSRSMKDDSGSAVQPANSAPASIAAYTFMPPYDSRIVA